MSGHGNWSGQTSRERRQQENNNDDVDTSFAYTQEGYNPNSIRNGYSGTVDGSDVTDRWTPPTSGEWGAEIESVMDEQRFRGKPKVVDATEFAKAAEEAAGGQGLILQRGYGATSSDVLDAYKQSLYDGEWYVSCGGGAAYGHGMYAAYSLGSTRPTSETTRTARGYASMYGNHTRVETMTLAPNARMVSYEDIESMMRSDRSGAAKARYNEGTYATMKGYDFMYTNDGSGYSVVLNRTKLIILNT